MNKFRKLAASVAAITTALSLSVGTLAVTANEAKKAIEATPTYTLAEKQFIDSYKNEGYTNIASFLINNDFSLSEAENIMNLYIDGKKKIAEESSKETLKKGSRTSTPFYSDSKLSGNQHFGVLVFNGSSTGTYATSSMFTYDTTKVGVSSDLNIRNCISNTIISGNGYGTTVFLGGSFTATETSQAFAEFPFNVNSSITNEANARTGFIFTNLLTGSPVVFETYVQGDFNHDGWVDTKDISFMLELQAGERSLDDLPSDYTGVDSNVALAINKLSVDCNRNGFIDLGDLTWITTWGHRDID